MKIMRFAVNPFGENCYVAWDELSCEAAVIDPGVSNEYERKLVDDFIAKNALNVKYLLITHLHVDHVLGASYISEKYSVQPMCSRLEAENGMAETLNMQAEMFGLNNRVPDLGTLKPIDEGDKLELGNESISVFAISGHSPSSNVYYAKDSKVLFSGDVLFSGSIGRADLPGGNEKLLIEGIKRKILLLPDETTVCPGHGPATTVGDERIGNYFLR